MALPPWLNIGPTDFLRATQSGAALGQAIAESNLRAWENQQRMQMEQERYKQAMAQRALQQQALQQYRQGQLEARSRALDLQGMGLDERAAMAQQGLDLRGQGLDLQRQRLEDVSKFNEQRTKDAEEREKDRQAQRDFMNDMRQKEFERREREAERARQGHFFQGPDGATYVVPPGETKATKVELPTDKKESDSSTTSIMPNALNALGTASRFALGSNPLLHNLAPLVPTYQGPAAGTVPSAGTNAPSAIPSSPTVTNAPVTPKKRVRVKGPKGQTGTIEEGDALPEGWTTQ